MKAKNIIGIIVAMFAVASLSSCSTSEKCWAYNSCKTYKSKTFKNHTYVQKPAKVRNAKAYGCYNGF